MKKQKLKVKDTQILLSNLKAVLEKCTDVSAAYLFGSAAQDEHAVNDLDILILLHKYTNKNEAYINAFSLPVSSGVLLAGVHGRDWQFHGRGFAQGGQHPDSGPLSDRE